MAVTTRCRTLIAGFGRPGMRDLDFGRSLVRYLESMAWPDGVVVEDLAYAAPLVLHRLQELEPAKLVLVGAAARGFDAPGALRRYTLDTRVPAAHDVQRSLEASLQGEVDIDQTLAVARHWSALPADTVVIEVEPADCSFGPGFSEELAAVFDPMLAMVLDELGSERPESPGALPESSADLSPGDGPVSEPLNRLVDYAAAHRAARLVSSGPRPPSTVGDPDGVSVAACSRPWGVNARAGSDWYDVVALGGGWFGVAIGDAPGRGVEAAPAMADLRAALRAYALLGGPAPHLALERLDRFAASTGTGEGATVLFCALHPQSGELRISNAGHCPPLAAGPGRGFRPLAGALAGAVGTSASRPEVSHQLEPVTTLVFFTDGLAPALQDRTANGDETADEIADHLFEASLGHGMPDDDITLLVVKLTP